MFSSTKKFGRIRYPILNSIERQSVTFGTVNDQSLSFAKLLGSFLLRETFKRRTYYLQHTYLFVSYFFRKSDKKIMSCNSDKTAPWGTPMVGLKKSYQDWFSLMRTLLFLRKLLVKCMILPCKPYLSRQKMNESCFFLN